MNVNISRHIIENKKLYEHLKENSYFIKELNRNPAFFKNFTSKIKEIYKERASDKLSSAIDNVEFISSIIDTLK